MVAHTEMQRIARLTPLRDALAGIDAVAPVAAREVEAASAGGRILAADILARAGRPPTAVALRDGWAVHADALADASAYAPAPLTAVPIAMEPGDTLPDGTDAIAEPDTVIVQAHGAEAMAAVAPGDGVLPAHADAAPGMVLRRAGERVRQIDLAVFAALGATMVSVREPRVRVVRAGRSGAIMLAGCAFIAAAVESAGGCVIVDPIDAGDPDQFTAALHHEGADAVIAVGGTGIGAGDSSVRTLAAAGALQFHGLGVSPGETTAFGVAAARPVLLLPGRLDAVLAVWLLLGRPLLARLAGAVENDPTSAATLARKVASTVGLATVVPVRRQGDAVEPLATGYLPLHALAQADGWILIAPESEGYPAGATVAVRALP
jgi:molybdopterin molybdotransferase